MEGVDRAAIDSCTVGNVSQHLPHLCLNKSSVALMLLANLFLLQDVMTYVASVALYWRDVDVPLAVKLLLVVLFDQAFFSALGSPPVGSPSCTLSPLSIQLGLLTAGETAGFTNMLARVSAPLQLASNPFDGCLCLSLEKLLSSSKATRTTLRFALTPSDLPI